jgi:hypothetical protein
MRVNMWLGILSQMNENSWFYRRIKHIRHEVSRMREQSFFLRWMDTGARRFRAALEASALRHWWVRNLASSCTHIWGQAFLSRPLTHFSLALLAAVLSHWLIRGVWQACWELPSLSAFLLAIGMILLLAGRRLDSPVMLTGRLWRLSPTGFLSLVGGAFLGICSFEGRADLVVIVCATVGVLALAWHRPWYGLWMFVIFLPLHHLLMTILAEQTHLSTRALALAKSWKDLLLLSLGVRALGQHMLGYVRYRFRAMDLFFLLFALVLAWQFFRGGTPEYLTTSAKLQSLRFYTYFGICYYLGRVVPATEVQIRRLLWGISLLGMAAAVFGLLEKHFLLSDAWVALGYVDYIQDAFNQSYWSPNGLPFTFWIEGQWLRRIGSFFLGPLDMSYALLIIIPVALSLWAGANRGIKKDILYMIFGLMLLALIFAFSRAALAAFVCQLVVLSIAWAQRDWRYYLKLLIAPVLCILAIYIYEDLHNWVARTTTLEETSAAGHVKEWKNSIDMISSESIGTGLGSAGFTSVRNRINISGENQYLILARETGLPGLVAFLGIMFMAIFNLAGWLAAWEHSPRRDLTAALLAGMLGIALVGITSQVYLNYFAVFILWWVYGWIETANQR